MHYLSMSPDCRACILRGSQTMRGCGHLGRPMAGCQCAVPPGLRLTLPMSNNLSGPYKVTKYDRWGCHQMINIGCNRFQSLRLMTPMGMGRVGITHFTLALSAPVLTQPLLYTEFVIMERHFTFNIYF